MKVKINKENDTVEVYDDYENPRFTLCGMPEPNGWRMSPLDSENVLVVTRSRNGKINAWIENVPEFQKEFRWMFPK